jgi:hypothetical protein
MVCGEPADKFKRRVFTWYPRWAGLLLFAGIIPGAFAMLILSQRKTVDVPFCASHRNYFRNRGIAIWLSLIAFIVLGVVAIFLPDLYFLLTPEKTERETIEKLSVVIWSILGFFLLVEIVFVVIMLNTGVRAREITESRIGLTGVSEAFVDAMNDLREAREDSRREDEEDEDEDRPRRRRDEDDEDDRPRRRRRDEDEDFEDRPRRRRRDDDEEGEDRPRRRRRDDGEDDRPSRRRDEEEYEDRPRRSRRRDDDEEDRPRRRQRDDDDEDRPRSRRDADEEAEDRPPRRSPSPEPEDEPPPRKRPADEAD